jgi:hypothetical protein
MNDKKVMLVADKSIKDDLVFMPETQANLDQVKAHNECLKECQEPTRKMRFECEF